MLVKISERLLIIDWYKKADLENDFGCKLTREQMDRLIKSLSHHESMYASIKDDIDCELDTLISS